MTATINATTATLPLSQLRIDEKSNVRHANRGLDPVLVSSIKAIGLRSPLAVRKNGKGYVIFAGGQRFLALQEIAKERGEPDMPVPVIITDEADAAAREASLHENVARSAMHPVDEYRAYAQLANDKERPMSVDQIAKRFGVSEKGVHQRLALGQLDDSVLNAWQADELDGKAAKLFTMQPDKKAQKSVLEQLRVGGYMHEHTVREALGLGFNSRAGKLLELVTEDAYLARGGKVMRDLFADERSDNTSVSDPVLLKAMGDELIDREIARLSAEGWGTVSKVRPTDMWSYPQIDVTGRPTKEEAARLKEIEKIFAAAEKADEYLENNDELEEEQAAIQQKIEERALATIDAKKKEKALVFVSLSHDQSRIIIEFRNPPKATSTGTAGKDKTKDKSKAAAEDAISQALQLRQAEQMTAAAQLAVTHQPHVAMAILIAGISSNDDALGIHQTSMSHNRPKFAATLASALKLNTTDQIKVLTELVSKNINLVKRYPAAAVLDDASHRALAEAIDGKKLTAITREKFDAKDYFASVSRTVIVEAVREAMGEEHARKVSDMKKDEAAKFATANLPKLKWLPKQLRVPGYDGPTAKAAPKPAAKASAKKAPATAAKKAKR
ncbi:MULTISPECIES: ParB/RepB/Spo0J family partition protein [unclassified Bradyrhizobium]|uniref:ParB/RepB/Spo0J family partition protein n=1 Tax=unclassified Bradyrhizobium TaxID=2631580 RepID=UPI0028E5834F|nr:MULTISPECIES: ParB/RepB/Spo0J family partition protein [unclassified Bradyrhizobium]